MIRVNYSECKKAGIDDDEVRKIAACFQRAMLRADKLGISVFGGSSQLTLRVNGSELEGEQHMGGQLIVGEMDGCVVSGGCGAQGPGPDGLIRGEA
ncbi:MAG: hypothetical protein AAFX93_19480 [Verrucomicrobiota bacterium]